MLVFANQPDKVIATLVLIISSMNYKPTWQCYCNVIFDQAHQWNANQPDNVIVKLVVGGQRGESTSGNGEGEEDLDGGCLPDLDVVEPRKIRKDVELDARVSAWKWIATICSSWKCLLCALHDVVSKTVWHVVVLG